jgi:hypothetical protein
MNELLRKLVANDWLGVKAMVPPDVRSVLLDAVFETEDADIRLSGKVHLLEDGRNEAFSLAVYEHVRKGWWEENAVGETDWKPRILDEEWARESLRSMLVAPRQARFYSDPRLRRRMYLAAPKSLDDCSALEFIKDLPSGERKRVVFAASNEYPGAIEMATASDECNVILRTLKLINIS